MKRWHVRAVSLLACSLFFAAFGASAQAEELRTWTDTTGTHTREAIFEKLLGDVVHLRTKEGVALKIGINKLSEADQRYARDCASRDSDPFEEADAPSAINEPMVEIADGDGDAPADEPREGVAKSEDPQAIRQIEESLKQDVGLVTAARTTSEVALLMKDVNLSGCPPDFRKAYLEHIHEWENAAVFEGKIQEFNEEQGSAGAFLEAFIRGYMGDVTGPVLEAMQGTKQLKAEAAEVQQRMHSSYQAVEAIAVRHGVDLRRVNALRKFFAANSASVSAAAASNPRGMALLGHAFASCSNPLVKDDAEAIRWFRLSAEAGDGFGMALLGGCYENGNGVAQDEVEALRWYRSAAKAGDALGMFSLSRMYTDGRGVEKNDNEGARWCRKAAEAGHGFSMALLATRYQCGFGVTKDEAEAVRWYQKAAEAGDTHGMVGLASMYIQGSGVAKNDSEALLWLRKAADAGSAEGMSKLAAMYQSGAGIAKDDAEAARWHRKAVEAGSTESTFILGTMYEFGQGVEKDENEAAGLYHEAAKAGHALAMFFVGMGYQQGTGFAKDEAEAVRWYRRSAEAGHPAAMTQLAKMLQSGSGVQQNDSEAVIWFRKGAEAGDGVAMVLFGNRCETGNGVQKDLAEAARWYRQVLATPTANDACRQFAEQKLNEMGDSNK